MATQGIRGGANRETLKRIKESGDIFFAESDRPWILEGANVHISMIAFDEGVEPTRKLDGRAVTAINPDLTAKADISRAVRLQDNLRIGFMGTTKQGPFDVDDAFARGVLFAPNPNQRPNSDVLIPWVNGLDLTRRLRGFWIVDFHRHGLTNSGPL